MSGYQNTPMKKRVVEEYKRQADDSNDMSEGYYNNMMSSPEMPKCDQTGQEPEREKRIRREIANSNERRRMQSINSGFQQLRNLIPASDGEKLSKAAILQQTSQYLYKLQKEKDQLGSANMQLKHMLSKFNNMDSDSCSGQDSPPPKRKKHDTVSSDEGVGGMTPETDDGGGGGGSSSRTSSSSSLLEELKREMVELRGQLERERRIRRVVEEEKLQLEEQLTAAHTERLGGGAGAAAGGGGGAGGGGDGGHARIPDIHARIPFYYPPPVHEEKYMVPPPAGTQYVFSPGAIKTEQERPTPATPPPPPQQQQNPPSPIASQMSRQNLETIVQAIRHLEGEIFNDDLSVDKENSIARKEARKSLVSEKHPVLKDELHRPIAATQFNRPGVIVQS